MVQRTSSAALNLNAWKLIKCIPQIPIVAKHIAPNAMKRCDLMFWSPLRRPRRRRVA
jgi:hypothetical protein